MNASTKRQLRTIEKLRLPELQARYAELVGRESKSPNRAFLLRKISEALEAKEGSSKTTTKKRPSKPQAKPKAQRSESGRAAYKVIPLRIEANVLQQIDAARKRLEIPNRSVLIRWALWAYLDGAGEKKVAALLDP